MDTEQQKWLYSVRENPKRHCPSFVTVAGFSLASSNTPSHGIIHVSLDFTNVYTCISIFFAVDLVGLATLLTLRYVNASLTSTSSLATAVADAADTSTDAVTTTAGAGRGEDDDQEQHH